MTGGAARRGERGFALLGVVLGAAGTLVGIVIALAVVIAVIAPGAEQGCEALDDGGEPIGPSVGSLGGVAGSGVSRAELQAVRASPQAGSTLTTGAYRSTAYGPPWGGIQGAGVATAGGIRIDGGAPRKYIIAADPRVIALGQWVYAWPNPFGWRGAFLAADTGGAIKGRAIDFYDWRGRAYQNRWNQPTTVSDRPGLDEAGADGGIPVTAAGRVDGAAARRLDAQLTGQPVGFALVDAGGRVLAAAAPNATNRAASITRAMILIALTQQARARALSDRERDLAAAMIRRSDDAAANALLARVGAAGVGAVARRAGMTRFELVRGRQAAAGFMLGSSRVSAVDQARLFARIDRLAAARHRAFAMTQLESVEGTGRFGVLAAELNARVRSTGGWRPEEDGGWTVNQAAQVTIGETTYGFAVVLGAQQTFERGAGQIAALTRAAFTTAAATLPGDCAAAPAPSSQTGERIGQIARRHLGRDARRQSFAAFEPATTRLAWCAWFTTNVWRQARVPIRVDWFSGHHYAWGKHNRTLFKDLGAPPRGVTPPAGSALMYGSGPQDPGTSLHVNLVDAVNSDGSFMITGGNQDTSRVTRQGPCRMTRSHPARLRGVGCDPRPIYAIAAPTPAT